MTDKKEIKSQKSKDEPRHVFEIHTMAKDNELKAQGLQEAPKKTVVKPPVQEKQVASSDKKNAAAPAANPFLTQIGQKQPDVKKGSFAPQKKTEPVEKINQTPADIAPKKVAQKPPKEPTNVVRMMMIVFITIFILGAIGFGIYIFFFSADTVEEFVAMPIEEIEAEPAFVPEPVKQFYATDLPNYFTLDVESINSQSNIATELATIEKNMRENDITGPISFIVNDMNQNPVSFHVFALSAGMDVPQDMLTSLEETFEIYAYDDLMHGIRFGFAIDVKNINLLQEALTAQEAQIPQAFKIILGDAQVDPEGIIFSDNVYGTHPIRFVNFNEAESYAIDYTVHNRSWLIGSTKKSLRAIIDKVKESKIPQEASEDFAY